MARFEQPTYEVGRGGGIDMNEEALWVIEKYLQLVREHLTDSIAEDVIGEIRAYLIEAAEDLSQEEITVEAAKKVVAGFGAPSEVAKEYASSLSTEEKVSETLEESIIKSQDLQKPVEVQQNEVQEPIKNEVGYASTFAKIITLTVLWMTISWTSVAIIAPWILITFAIYFPVFQFLILIVEFSIMLRETKKKGMILLDRTYPEWSGLQKLLTFPENAPFRPSENARMLDIMLTVLGAGFFILGLLYAYSSFEYFLFVNFVAFPLAILLSLRSIIIIRELGGLDPAHFVRQEYAIDAISLIFLNIAVSWVFSSTPLFLPMMLFLAGYAFILSINLLYQLVVKGQELWWKVLKIHIPREPELLEEEEVDLPKLQTQVKVTAKQALKRLTLLFLSLPLIGSGIVTISGGPVPGTSWYMHGILIILSCIFIWLLATGLVSVYFGVRYYLIKSRGRKTVIGKRSRRESLIDGIFTGITLLMFMTMSPFWIGNTVSSFFHWMLEYSYQHQLFLNTTLVSFYILLLFGLVLRLISDIINLVWRENKSSLCLMSYSGHIFMLTIAILFGLHFAAADFFDYYIWLFLYALFASILVSFQTVTTRIKQNWFKKKKEIDTEVSIEIA